MDICIRPADPATDYDRTAELLNLAETQTITADTLHEWDRRRFENQILRRTVAADPTGSPVGYRVVVHAPWAAEGRFYLHVIVDTDCRRQGIGAALYQDGLEFARQHGATFLDSETREDCPEGLRFAQQRGFSVDHHLFESSMDLRTFDDQPFAGVIESVRASGIRLFTLAEAGDTLEMRRQLWEVNYRTHLDDPSSAGTFPSFDELQEIWARSAWFQPEDQFLAADGDRVIGLSVVGYFAESNSMYNLMTGVLRAYRGRHIALALKLLTIRYAQQHGAGCIRTNNDSSNAPMLAINRKLGYVPRPGIYRLVCDLKLSGSTGETD